MERAGAGFSRLRRRARRCRRARRDGWFDAIQERRRVNDEPITLTPDQAAQQWHYVLARDGPRPLERDRRAGRSAEEDGTIDILREDLHGGSQIDVHDAYGDAVRSRGRLLCATWNAAARERHRGEDR